jgi:hypothetical protein
VAEVRHRVAKPLRGKEYQEVSGPLRGEEDRGVVADIIVTPQSILVRKHTVVQAHLLPERTGDLGWMN